MTKTEKPSWQLYLEGDVIGKETVAKERVYQVVIRVRPEGLQGIVKVRAGDVYKVVFVGAGSFPALAGKIRDQVNEGVEKWKEDRYPPT